MNLNQLIKKIDVAPGVKTTVVAALILFVSVMDYFGLVDRISAGLGATIINVYLIPALAITLGLKVIRPEGSPLITGSGLAIAAAAATSLFLSGCVFSVGPDGSYLHGELDPGVCMAANAGEYLNVGLGFCTAEGASTETLDADAPEL